MTTNPQKVIQLISKQINNSLITKYNQLYSSLELSEDDIQTLVSHKVKNITLNKENLQATIESLTNTIDKIVIKKIYEKNNSKDLVQPEVAAISDTIEPTAAIILNQESVKKPSVDETSKMDLNLINDDREKQMQALLNAPSSTPTQNTEPQQLQAQPQLQPPVILPPPEPALKPYNRILIDFTNLSQLETTVNLKTALSSLSTLSSYKENNMTNIKISLNKCVFSKYLKTYQHPFIIIKINTPTKSSLFYQSGTEPSRNILGLLDIFEKQNHLLFYNVSGCECEYVELEESQEDIVISVHNHLGELIKVENVENNKQSKEGFMILNIE
jgi:hypothetical protein